MSETSNPPLAAEATLATRLERLVTGGPELIAELSLEGVLQAVADLAAEVIGARYSAVGLLAADGRTLEMFTTHGMTEEQLSRMPIGHRASGSWVWSSTNAAACG